MLIIISLCMEGIPVLQENLYAINVK